MVSFDAIGILGAKTVAEHESHRVYARVKSELLVWARKRSALDLDAAARKADVLPEVLQEWEQGVSKPTIPHLRKLAEAYNFALAVFYLSTPPRFRVMRAA